MHQRAYTWCCAKKGYRRKRPRHCLKSRQDKDAVEKSGLRLKLLKMQAQAGDIMRLFADASEALTHPYLVQRWARGGQYLRIEAPGGAKRRASLGVRETVSDQILVRTSPTKKSSDFIDLLT